ncbi:hypothetical protein [Thermonema sp.]|uniref:hypothetical protein n=1 Tax=Thermonema sp. TaxID=2231181 RepID=UPI0025902BED|nr:hypothetical protein [Thermonema sp.]
MGVAAPLAVPHGCSEQLQVRARNICRTCSIGGRRSNNLLDSTGGVTYAQSDLEFETGVASRKAWQLASQASPPKLEYAGSSFGHVRRGTPHR